MNRILYTKTGDGIYLSHLDLMRVFQRAFRRAEVGLRFSQGFSPRAYVSVALPLSVGTESICEILDFELEGDAAVPSDLAARLNETMPRGVEILEVYESTRKIKELRYLSVTCTPEYDAGVPQGASDAILALLTGESITVTKHSKKGDAETDIRPMIHSVSVREQSPNELRLDAVICAQNPSLNPMLLAEAIRRYLPQYAPDFFSCRREDLLDGELNRFR